MANVAVQQAPAEKKQRHASRKARRIAADVVVYILLTVMAIAWVLPIVWIILQSFTGEYGLSMSKWIPEIWDFEVQEGAYIDMGNGVIRSFNYTLGPFGN